MQDHSFFLLVRISKSFNKSLMEGTFFLQEVEEVRHVAALKYLCLEGICRSFS